MKQTDIDQALAQAAQNELERAEGWKVRATEIASLRAALETEMAAQTPMTAVGAQAHAEVKRALLGQTGTAAERVAARVAARQGGAAG